MTKQQHFGWFLSRGFGPHGWARPYYEWNYDWRKPGLYQEGARTLEQAGFDFVLIEDALSVGISPETLDLRVRKAYGGPKHDPWTLAPYLFAATEHLGVIPTANPAGWHPYTAARQFASLQHLSSGRLGLNVVTDVGSAHHFGQDRLPHDAAYDRAQEWLDALRLLWRSWDDGALIADPETQIYADGSKIRAVEHRGKYFSFDGPLNAEPLPSEPVIASPGGSPRGIRFAGENSADPARAVQPRRRRGPRLPRARPRRRCRARPRSEPRSRRCSSSSRSWRPPSRRPIASSRHPLTRTTPPSSQVAEAWSSDLETDLTTLDLDRPLDPAIFGEPRVAGHHQGSARSVRLVRRCALPRRSSPARHGSGVSATASAAPSGTAEELADLIQALGDDADNDGLIFSGDLHPVTLHRALDETRSDPAPSRHPAHRVRPRRAAGEPVVVLT